VLDAVAGVVRSSPQDAPERIQDHVVRTVAAGVDGDLPVRVMEPLDKIGQLVRLPEAIAGVAGPERMVLTEQESVRIDPVGKGLGAPDADMRRHLLMRTQGLEPDPELLLEIVHWQVRVDPVPE
jgi:hypothetical protein